MTNSMICRGILAYAVAGVMLGCSGGKQGANVAPANVSNPASNPAGAPVSVPTATSPAPAAELTDAQMDALISDVSAAMRKKHMTEVKDQCLAYDVDTETDAYVVNVRENHVAGCGGDANVSPRLFSVRVDKKSRAMMTDKGTSGTFHPM